MAVCVRCNKRAAKRFCPALNTKICAICCARERMIDLACPESCQYLRDAREKTIEREQILRMKELEAEGKVRRELEHNVISAIFLTDETMVLAYREKFPDLKDEDIAMAVENAIKNIETEDTGLIYEHHAPSPRIQELSRRIREALEKRVSEEFSEHRLSRSDKIKGLNFVLEEVQAHMKRHQGPASESRNYLRYTSLFIPWSEEATSPLIITK